MLRHHVSDVDGHVEFVSWMSHRQMASKFVLSIVDDGGMDED
jgi:hypothetical protein